MDLSPLEHPLTAESRLFFLHIRKTGGITFANILRSYFALSEISPRLYPPKLSQLPDHFFEPYRYYEGHTDYDCIRKLLPKPLACVTLLREPVDRYLSECFYLYHEYLQARGSKAKQNPQIFWGEWSSWLGPFLDLPPQAQVIKFAESPGLAARHNNQTHMLGGRFRFENYAGLRASLSQLPSWDWAAFESLKFADSPPNLLGQAKACLAGLTSFGLTERFQDSLYLLAYTFGWPFQVDNHRFNVTPTRLHQADLPAETQARIIEVNRLDLELYAYAQQLFEARFNQMSHELLENYGGRAHAHLSPPLPTETLTDLLDKHYIRRLTERQTPARSFSFGFDRAIPGVGWHLPEQHPRHGPFRWSGPDCRATLDLLLRPDGAARIIFSAIAAITPETLDSLRLQVNSQPVQLHRYPGREGAIILVGYIPETAFIEENGFTRLTFEVDRTIAPATLTNSDDDRPLGLALNQLEIHPLTAADPGWAESCRRLIAPEVLVHLPSLLRPSDIIIPGQGWYPLESYQGETFYWASNNAELIIYSPTGQHTHLSLEVEPGPGLNSQPLRLRVLDSTGQVMAVFPLVRGRQTIQVNLPLKPGPQAVFRLYVEGGGHPIPTNPRILNFRVFRFGWDQKTAIRKSAADSLLFESGSSILKKYPFTTETRMAFLHIPKTAGTTFDFILRQGFTENAAIRSLDYAKVLQTPNGFYKAYRYYQGHMHYGLVRQLLPPETVYLTLLREPVERYLSQFAQWQRIAQSLPEGVQIEWLKTPFDLLPYLDVIDYVDNPSFSDANCQTDMLGTEFDFENYRDQIAALADLTLQNTRALTNLYKSLTIKREPEVKLAQAKQCLTEIAFLGLTERFQDSLYLLAYTFGWPPYEDNLYLNTAPSRRQENLPAAALDKVTSLNKVDLELYTYAQQLFETRFSQMTHELLERYGKRDHAHLKLPLPSKVMAQLMEKHYIKQYQTGRSISFSFGQTIFGQGWYQAVTNPQHGSYRWSGPNRCSTLNLPLNFEDDAHLIFSVMAAITPEVLDSLSLRVNGYPIILTRYPGKAGDTVFVGNIPHTVLAAKQGLVRLTFEVNQTLAPAWLSDSNPDLRRLGIAFKQLEIYPAGENNPDWAEACSRLLGPEPVAWPSTWPPDLALQTDTITTGQGWHRVETDRGERFCWITNEAELIIERPTGRCTHLSLEVEPGPGLNSQPLRLRVLDSTGQVVAVFPLVRGRQTIQVNLPLKPGPRAVFRLYVEGGGHPIPTDPRILNFRVFQFGWDQKTAVQKLAAASPRVWLSRLLSPRLRRFLKRQLHSFQEKAKESP